MRAHQEGMEREILETLEEVKCSRGQERRASDPHPSPKEGQRALGGMEWHPYLSPDPMPVAYPPPSVATKHASRLCHLSPSWPGGTTGLKAEQAGLL